MLVNIIAKGQNSITSYNCMFTCREVAQVCIKLSIDATSWKLPVLKFTYLDSVSLGYNVAVSSGLSSEDYFTVSARYVYVTKLVYKGWY